MFVFFFPTTVCIYDKVEANTQVCKSVVWSVPWCNVRAKICSAAEAKAELEDFKVLFSGQHLNLQRPEVQHCRADLASCIFLWQSHQPKLHFQQRCWAVPGGAFDVNWSMWVSGDISEPGEALSSQQSSWHSTILARFPPHPGCAWLLGFTLTKITLCTWQCFEPSNQLLPVLRWFEFIKAPSEVERYWKDEVGGGFCCLWSWGSTQNVLEKRKKQSTVEENRNKN